MKRGLKQWLARGSSETLSDLEAWAAHVSPGTSARRVVQLSVAALAPTVFNYGMFTFGPDMVPNFLISGSAMCSDPDSSGDYDHRRNDTQTTRFGETAFAKPALRAIDVEHSGADWADRETGPENLARFARRSAG